MPEQNPTLQIKHICLKIKSNIDINEIIKKTKERLQQMKAGQTSLASPNTFIVIYDSEEDQYFFFIVFDGSNITMRHDSLLYSLQQNDVNIQLYKTGRFETFTTMTTFLQNKDFKLIHAPK